MPVIRQPMFLAQCDLCDWTPHASLATTEEDAKKHVLREGWREVDTLLCCPPCWVQCGAEASMYGHAHRDTARQKINEEGRNKL